MTHKPSFSYIRQAAKALLFFCAFQVLQLELPLLLYENGGGLSALPLCVEKMLPADLYTLLLFGALVLLQVKTPASPLRAWEKLFCWAFALFLMLGDSYAAIDSWDLVFGSPALILLSVFTLLGAAGIAQCALRWAKHFIPPLLTKDSPLPRLWERHPFLLPWLIIFLCWLPYLLIRLPAAIEHDAYMQIEQVFGLREFTAHNPVLSTVLMGLWIKLGVLLGSKELGLTLFTLFQSLSCSAMLAYTISAMKRLKAPNRVILLSAGICALATIYPNYLTVIMKDSLYACMSVLLLALVAEELLLPHSRSRCLGILAAALLTGTLRNNGFLLLWALGAAAVICLVCSPALRRVGMTAALLTACLLQALYANALLPALGIPEGPMYESLSVPFQQTARYVRDFPEDVTPQEREVIDAILVYEDLAERYDPNLSDPVKNSCTGDTSVLPAYWKVWCKQLLRHPTAYIQATLNNAYGFFHPNSREYIFWYTTISTNPELVFDEIELLSPLKTAARYLVMLFESFPLTMPLCNTGCYMWLALYLLGKAIERRDRPLLVLYTSILMSMLVCICCPVFFINGVRYALPVIFAVPLLTALTLRHQSAE